MAGSLQRTRGFHFEKVKTAPGSTNDRKIYTFRANDGDFDRYQDRLSVKGWQLRSFNALKGPVLLNHDAGDGGFLGMGRKDVLSLGKARAFVEGDALMVDIEFDPNDPEAVRVEKKLDWLETGAVSVRYVIPEGEYRENEKGGLDSDVQELLEISIVTIPGNQRALRVKGLGAEDEDLVEKIALRAAQIVVKALDDRDARHMNTKSDPTTIRDIAAMALKSLQTERP